MKLWPFGKSKKSKEPSKRAYEGAAKSNRTSAWVTGSTDANGETRNGLGTLRDRSRELRRNNPYAAKAVSLVTNNVVGKGIITQFNDETLQKLWKEWAHTTSIDYDGRNDIFGLQRMAMDAVFESGEVLIRRRFVNDPKHPIKYQLLEADFLDNSVTLKPSKNGNFIIQGIEFDSNGRRVGYHIYKSHPGSIDHAYTSFESSFIPASDIRHIFRADRPGQVRGVPWLAPVMMRLKDLDSFEDAQLLKQKVAACFTAFVHDISAEVECEDNPDATLQDKIEPGLIEFLPPGRTVTFANPPKVENYKEFTSGQIRSIAAGIGVSYESFAADLSEVNFSSARMGWIEMNRNIEAWRSGIIIPHMVTPIISDFFLMLEMIGVRVGDNSHTNISPKREMIDPAKEVPAMVTAMRAGLKTRKATIASLGDDSNEIDKQFTAENAEADKNNFIFDSDPRKTDQTGKFQKEENSNEQTESED